MSDEQMTRRQIIKKAAYIAPLILTVQANFAYASAGSGDYYADSSDNDKTHKKDEKVKKDFQNNFIDLTNKTHIK